MIECGTGTCGIPARRTVSPMRGTVEEQSAGGVFTDRYHDSGPEALRALLAWRAMPATQWFSALQANRDAWARSWVSTLGIASSRERSELVAAVLAVSAAQLGVTTGGGSTPVRDAGGGSATGGAACEVPANWSTMTGDQRQAWAQGCAAARGLTPAQQREFEERARAADNALIRGLVTEGLSTLRTYLETQSAERLALIEAQSRVAGAQTAAERQAAETILAALRAQGAGGGNGATRAKKSGAGAALGLGALLLLAARGGV